MSAPGHRAPDDETRDLIGDWLDHRLDPAERARVRVRLEADPSLAAELEAVETACDLLREDTASLPGAPSDFSFRVRAAIDRGDFAEGLSENGSARARARGGGRPGVVRWIAAAYAAAALVLVGFTAIWYAERDRGGNVEVESARESERLRAPRERDATPVRDEVHESVGAFGRGAATSAPLEAGAKVSRDRGDEVADASVPRTGVAPFPPPAVGAPGAPRFDRPAGGVDRGQRTPSDEVQGLREVAVEGVRYPGRLVVEVRDVDAFVTWLALLRAGSTDRPAEAVGLERIHYVTPAEVEAEEGDRDRVSDARVAAKRVRFALDGPLWRRLVEALRLDVSGPAPVPRPVRGIDQSFEVVIHRNGS